MNRSYKTPVQFRGMMPILPTTILASGEIDQASQRRLVQYAIQCGAAAIGHFGFASEFFKLSDRDRTEITEIIIDETAGQVPVFIGVTAPSTRAAIDYVRRAEAQGADLLMAAIPYVTVPDKDGVFDYYRALADATTLPIILQDTPLSAPMLTAEMCTRLMEVAPNIQYVKAEGADFLAKTAKVMEAVRDRMQVIGGFGGKHLIHMLRLGVTSYMTGTEMLDLHAEIVRQYLQGDAERAAELYYERLLPYFAFYEMYPDELLKAMLHRRGIIHSPNVIAPRTGKAMSDIEWKEFEWVLKRIGFDQFEFASPEQSTTTAGHPLTRRSDHVA